jgi:formylglycine-generating enzyme required for sulfatase activity
MRKHPNRVIRGGSWFSNTTNLRCAFRRFDGFPVVEAFIVGFRPVIKKTQQQNDHH